MTTPPEPFDMNKMLDQLADNAGPKVEPSAQHRATARDVAQQFAAYRDEGFTRAEAIHLATLGTQIATRVMAEDYARRQNGEQP
ncbi:MAG: hypothetical protein U1C73_08260 [Dietzia sp.]|nr:hypothetical protein [Dietzia sp.]